VSSKKDIAEEESQSLPQQSEAQDNPEGKH